jgi:hypothetical protein
MESGAPALLDWLCSKGAADFRYSVDADPTFDFLEDR